MEISDIRVKLIQDSSDRLKAVCSITLDDEFVVRDLKVVEGTNGLFVAMPSRKLSVHCPQCRSKNHLRARFCNECGTKLPPARVSGEAAGRLRMHRDIAHPINPTFREIVQSRVIEKYRQEAELAKDPDYVPVDIDADFEDKVAEVQAPEPEPEPRHAPSEYDQLIAGLSKGAEAPREREPRPAPPAQRPRNNDRRPREDRPARSGRGGAPPRQAQRGDSRRYDQQRPARAQNTPSRPPLPSIMDTDAPDEELDKINGNVATPSEPPRPGRRPAPPRRNDPDVRRDSRPRRAETRPAGRSAPPPSRSGEDTSPPAPRYVDEPAPATSRYDEEPAPPGVDEPAAMPPAALRAPQPVQLPIPVPASTPPPAKAMPPAPAPARTSPKNDDLPFGAGL